MRIKLILLTMFMFSSIAIAFTFEFDIGGSFGTSIEFSYASGYVIPASSLQGNRIDSGFTANALLSIGRNDTILNNTLTSISSLFETGYNFYIRARTAADTSDEQYNNYYMYNSIILGYLFRLNFRNTISLGIGAGIFIPLYSESSKSEYVLGKYRDITEFNHDKIAFMYKLPFMPYVKLNLSKYFYISEKWAFKIGGNIIYNFGMELDNARLYGDGYYHVYEKYKFSSLSFELLVSISFGRPK